MATSNPRQTAASKLFMRLIVACSGVAFGQSIGCPTAKIVCINGVGLLLTYSTSVKKSFSRPGFLLNWRASLIRRWLAFESIRQAFLKTPLLLSITVTVHLTFTDRPASGASQLNALST